MVRLPRPNPNAIELMRAPDSELDERYRAISRPLLLGPIRPTIK